MTSTRSSSPQPSDGVEAANVVPTATVTSPDGTSVTPPQSSPSPPESSPTNARSGRDVGSSSSSSSAVRKERSRVRFNSRADEDNRPHSGPSPRRSEELSPPRTESTPVTRPRPSVLRTRSDSPGPGAAQAHHVDDEMEPEKAISAAAAQERARHVADRVRKDKNKQAAGRRDSIASDDSHDSQAISEHSYHGESIPLRLMAHGNESQQALITPGTPEQRARRSESIGRDAPLKEQALKLVRAHTRRFRRKSESETSSPAEPVLGATQSHATPSEVNNGIYDGVYTVPPPKQYRSSVLSQLLRLYKPNNEVMSNHGRNWSSSTLGLHAHQDDGGEAGHGGFSGGSSGAATPTRRKWYEQNKSHDTLANLVGASARLANPNLPTPDPTKPGPGRRWSRPTQHRRRRSSSNHMAAFLGRDEENRIAVHIAETLARQDYIVKLCQALMLYGAPTHRLEEYLSMTARALEIDGQFLYIPGSMVISFDDRSTHTAEVRMVRVTQGIDLGKLKDVHHVYKEVIHDVITIEEAIQTLDKLMQSPDKFNAWLRVFIFGLTSATAAPFSFNARLIDLPLCFFFGCLVGFLQLIVSPKSNLYSNVFEVSAVVLVSFLARVFGSLSGGNLFCFSALAQGGIVMLLPGYLVLCSSLEIQSKNIVAGSIRIVYAIVYSLLLGFGITVGSALYGVMDANASSATTCQSSLPTYVPFVFVPPFVVCISILYQAKWRQMPVMVTVAFAGYVVNYFSSLKFSASPQVASTLGALAVGILANLYSRLRHGVAAAALIPAIFTQVPGGLASTGGLLSGITTADMLTGDDSSATSTDSQNTVIFNVAASMVQIAIGIAVGLFLSALMIYPFGKRRSGLFSF